MAARRPACGRVPDGEPAGLCLVHQESPLSDEDVCQLR